MHIYVLHTHAYSHEYIHSYAATEQARTIAYILIKCTSLMLYVCIIFQLEKQNTHSSFETNNSTIISDQYSPSVNFATIDSCCLHTYTCILAYTLREYECPQQVHMKMYFSSVHAENTFHQDAPGWGLLFLIPRFKKQIPRNIYFQVYVP